VNNACTLTFDYVGVVQRGARLVRHGDRALVRGVHGVAWALRPKGYLLLGLDTGTVRGTF
jgi:hypothetical protein